MEGRVRAERRAEGKGKIVSLPCNCLTVVSPELRTATACLYRFGSMFFSPSFSSSLFFKRSTHNLSSLRSKGRPRPPTPPTPSLELRRALQIL